MVDQLPRVGWREWVSFPGLGIPAIKAKIDTGARTTAMHASDIEVVRREDLEIVRFVVHPLRRRPALTIECEAEVIGYKAIRNTGGQLEQRPIITTELRMGTLSWPIDISLTDRSSMLFRTIIGRVAVAGKCVVDPGASFVNGRTIGREYYASLRQAKKRKGVK